MGKIILFYNYVDIEYPVQIAKQQRALCEKLGIKGRILLAHEGVNATLGGTSEAIEQYKEQLRVHPLFFNTDIKESDGEADHFPRLKVVVKKEILNLGLDPNIVSAKNAGIYLSPEEAHSLMENAPEDLVIFDARNSYESRVGSFQNAVKPETNYFRELPQYLDEHADEFKDKQVLMFCTGGIRCEKATAYLRMKQIAKEVYHIKGGIHRYIEAFPDGYFRGKNYVFDGRVTHQVTGDILTDCDHCKKPYDDYSNCINAECNKQIIVCPDCITIYHNTCSERCKQLVTAGTVNIRTIPHKLLITPKNG